ncbi:MAG TPA: LysM domain-containing protein, partial [Candidatus Limnocylindrales bacterium]
PSATASSPESTGLPGSSSPLPSAALSPSASPSVSASPSPTPSSSASTVASPSPASSHHTYAVKSGDNLYAIAQRLGTTVEAILQLNPTLRKDPTKLVVGQVIVVP